MPQMVEALQDEPGAAQPASKPGLTVLFGVLAHAGSLVLAAILSAALDSATQGGSWFPWFIIGLVQLVWFLPWAIWAFATRRKHFGIGLVIGAALTALLNGACFVLLSIGGIH